MTSREGRARERNRFWELNKLEISKCVCSFLVVVLYNSI